MGVCFISVRVVSSSGLMVKTTSTRRTPEAESHKQVAALAGSHASSANRFETSKCLLIFTQAYCNASSQVISLRIVLPRNQSTFPSPRIGENKLVVVLCCFCLRSFPRIVSLLVNGTETCRAQCLRHSYNIGTIFRFILYFS